MKTAPFVQRMRTRIEMWFTVSESNAAGRLGIYRIVFSLFYLWHLSWRFGANLSGLPDRLRWRILMVSWIPGSALSPQFFQFLETALVAALVMLLIGLRVRLATAAVLILGSIYEAYYISVGYEHSTVMLAFYIPLFMLLCGGWGDCYSLDAFLGRRRGESQTEPENSHWGFSLGARAVLVVLSVLFLSSAIWKIIPGATWLDSPGLFGNIVLTRNIRASLFGLPVNPFAPLIASTPLLEVGARYFIVLAEGLFILALINRRWRNFFVSQTLVFHCVNALWLVVSFTPVIVVYGLFIDWHSIRQRLLPWRLRPFDRVPAPILTVLTLALAIAIGALWNSLPEIRAVFNLGGVADWRTIFIPILPVVFVWWLFSAKALVWPGSRGIDSQLRTSPNSIDPT